MSFELVQTVNGTEQGLNTIGFSNIPQDASDLMIIASLQSTTTTATSLDDVLIRFNGSGTNVASTFIDGNGATAVVTNRTTELGGNNEVLPVGLGAAFFGNIILYVNDYTSTIGSKTVDYISGGETGATTAHVNVLTGRWSSPTTAITQLDIRLRSGFLTAGSSASLYKITKS